MKCCVCFLCVILFSTISFSATYYVNDSSVSGDLWCTAVGNDSNNGQTPGTPKATVQSVISSHVLGANDIVYIDTGNYTLTSNIDLDNNDQGSGAGHLTFMGSTNGTVLNRNSTVSSTRVLEGNSSDYIKLVNLDMLSGENGLSLSGFCNDWIVSNCIIRSQGAKNVYVANGSTDNIFDRVTVHSGTSVSGFGMEFWGSSTDGNTVKNSLIYSNANHGIYAFNGAEDLIIENCTVAYNKGNQLHLRTGGHVITNSILLASGSGTFCIFTENLNYSFDYNNYYAVNGAQVGFYYDVNEYLDCTDGGGTHTSCTVQASIYCPTLADWQLASGQDANSISTDPLFADPSTGDYHLQSTAGRWNGSSWVTDAQSSPCIDAGDPDYDYSDEPSYNGGRINMGAYGNTDEASKTEQAGLVILTVSSAFGSPSPAVGSHNFTTNDSIDCSVVSPVGSGGTQSVCTGWTMTSNSPVSGVSTGFSLTITNDCTLTWTWDTQVQFTRTNSGNGYVTGSPDGWYDVGGSVTVTAVPNGGYGFLNWSGAVPGGQQTQNPLTLTMDQTRSITANFAVQQTLPFTETFETNPPTMAGVLGTLHGQHGWEATPTNSAQVQTNVVYAGEQAGALAAGALYRSFTDVQTNVWISFHSMPVFGDDESSFSNPSAVFRVNAASNVVAYNGQTETELTYSLTEGSWVEFKLFLDYGPKTWDLWVDGDQVVTNFAFYTNAASGFSELRIISDEAAPAYIDSVMIDTNEGATPSVTNVYTITATSGGNGTLSEEGAIQVGEGSNKTFTIIADEYYMISNVIINAVDVGPTSAYIFVNVQSNQTIHATFSELLTTNTGTPWWWLASFGLTNDTFEQEALKDTDDDSYYAWQERISGTVPTNSSSYLQLTNIMQVSGDHRMQFYGLTGRTYTVEYNDLLNQPTNWSFLGLAAPVAEGPVTITDTNAAPSRNYRIWVEFD